MVECCDASGGRVEMTINGKRYRSRGGITIMPMGIDKTAGVHDDGSIYTTTKAAMREASFNMSDQCDLDIDELLSGCHVDVTLKLIDMKIAYLFTKASVIGKPSINTDDGSISGIRIVSGDCKRIAV